MSSFVETIRSLGPARLAVLGGVFVGLLIFFVFVSAQVSKPSLTLLYGNLSSVDAASVAAKLEESNIPFEGSTDGSSIRVPKNEIGRARMLLAQAGLPNGGTMGYEIFDQKSGFGTTGFVQNINQIRALQGELARTIATLDPVDFAKVHLVLPQRELFARTNRDASASVTIKIKPAARLSREQIYGIQNLVANAVPELKPERVSIIDTDANLLAGGDRESGDIMTGLKAEEMRRSYEERLTAAVEDMVGRIVGFNKVRAHVTADLNFDRISTNSETYDPEGQVVRSTNTVEEGSTESEAGANQAVSVQNNVPGGAGGGTEGGGQSASNRTEETTNYEISKTVQSVVRESGEVKKISVAVLVDGAFVTDAEGNRTYQPRTEEELNKIEDLVKSAIGFDADRGDTVEVVNMAFSEVEQPEIGEDSTLFGFDRAQLLQTAEMIMLAVMGILVILLVLKPIMTSLFQAQKAAIEEARSEMLLAQNSSVAATPQLSGPSPQEIEARIQQEEDSLIDMNAVEGKVKASTVRKVGDIVSSHPNETVSIIRNWMTQE